MSKVKPYYHRDETGSAFGTFFSYGKGWITAGHVMEAFSFQSPPFAQAPIQTVEGFDIALLNTELTHEPLAPKPGMPIRIYGWPAGATRGMEMRQGKVLLRRDPSAWIAILDDGQLPVVTGMSGSLVIGKTGEQWKYLGVLTVRDFASDLDGDGDIDEACDFVALRDIWNAQHK